MKGESSTVKRLALTGLLALGCAETPRAPPPAPPVADLPPPSSILVVVAHRDELGLDDRQVSQLLALQKDLERLDAKAREDLAAGGANKARQRASSDGAQGRRRGGFGGGRGGGGAPRHPEEPVDREEALAQAYGDNDTQTLLQAEKVFTASQWERVQAVAEKYRMEYADRREALKRSGQPAAR